MEWSISFTSWLWIIFTVCLFLFVVYLTATDQLEDFLRLVGLMFISIGGVLAVFFAVLFVLFLKALPFLVVIGGSLLLVKCIFF